MSNFQTIMNSMLEGDLSVGITSNGSGDLNDYNQRRDRNDDGDTTDIEDYHGAIDFNYVGGQAGINLFNPAVYSPLAGVVEFVGGNYGAVLIPDVNCFMHQILHSNSQDVSVGSTNLSGSLIGTKGGTGPTVSNADAQHFHYQLKDSNGGLLSPAKYGETFSVCALLTDGGVSGACYSDGDKGSVDLPAQPLLPSIPVSPLALLLVLALAVPSVFSAEFGHECIGYDENWPLADIKLCHNPQLSELDYLLRDTYKAYLKESPNPQKVRKVHDLWDSTVRKACQSNRCLVQAYEERIRAYGGEPPVKDNFRMPDRAYTVKACSDYLGALNRTPLEAIHACHLPDLSGTDFKSFNFTRLTGEALKMTDQLIYEQQNPKLTNWQQKWPETKEAYDTGARIMSEAFIDIDEDGEPERIIQVSYASYDCADYISESESTVDNMILARKKWQSVSNEYRADHARAYGYKNAYLSLKDGVMSYVDANQLIQHENRIITIFQGAMRNKNIAENAMGKNWINLSSIRPALDTKNKRYGSLQMCEFWLND